MKTRNERLESLKIELKEIQGNLFSNENRTEVLNIYRSKEIEIKQLNKEIELFKYNKEHKEKRELARIIFELELIELNDITNDSQINKNRLKKYPNCSKLDYLFFCSQDFKANYYEVNHNGKWKVFFYENGTYKKIESFNHFLDINAIEQKEISLVQYTKIENNIKKQNDKIKKLEMELKELKDSLYKYNTNGLIRQERNTIYSFTTKF